MPYFTPEVNDLNIDIDDFYFEMSSKEKQKMYEMLGKDGYASEVLINVPEWEFSNIISKIDSNRLLLTVEEDELLKKIASRF